MAGPTATAQQTTQQKRQKIEGGKAELQSEAEAMDTEKDLRNPAMVPAAVTSEIVGFRPEYLKLYYGRLFPYSEMYRWLSYGHDRSHPGSDSMYLTKREFSFTLEHDIYVRYQSFKDAAEMEQAIRDKCPHKIDIGAVFNVDPAKRTAYQSLGSERVFAPVERELVFDVDMTDYDDIRTCCSGADICSRCWPLMTIAIKVVDTALREDFGYEHLLWVFSGRRGVHCWVCDSRARRLTNEQRSAVAEYFHVYKGSENNTKKVNLSGAALHPALTRAYDQVLRRFFEDMILPGQALLANEEAWSKILDLVPDEDVRARMEDKWRNDRRSSDDPGVNAVRWKQLETAVKASAKKNLSLRRCLEEIVFIYTYPRLDLEVSKHMNHLLKAPFCIHPKTGKVCVPIDPETCEEFDPQSSPTISQLLNELNASEREKDSSSSRPRDLDRTSLKPAVALFHSSFLDSLLRTCKTELEAVHQERLHEKVSAPSLAW